MSSSAMPRYLLAILIVAFEALPSLQPPSSARAQTDAGPAAMAELEASFQAFLEVYWQELKDRNRTFLASVHPKLPQDMYDFFFDMTLSMMRYSEDNPEVEPAIECQEFNICKVVYPQPNGSWAAQRFILYEGTWRWLDQ